MSATQDNVLAFARKEPAAPTIPESFEEIAHGAVLEALRRRGFSREYADFVSMHVARALAEFTIKVAIDPAHASSVERLKTAYQVPLGNLAFRYADLLWQAQQAGLQVL